jgi:hypothetical protein
MTLIALLFCFSALCWAVVIWSWRRRRKQRDAEITATEIRRAIIERRQHPRRREQLRSHLRVVSSKRR